MKSTPYNLLGPRLWYKSLWKWQYLQSTVSPRPSLTPAGLHCRLHLDVILLSHWLCDHDNPLFSGWMVSYHTQRFSWFRPSMRSWTSWPSGPNKTREWEGQGTRKLSAWLVIWWAGSSFLLWFHQSSRSLVVLLHSGTDEKARPKQPLELSESMWNVSIRGVSK